MCKFQSRLLSRLKFAHFPVCKRSRLCVATEPFPYIVTANFFACLPVKTIVFAPRPDNGNISDHSWHYVIGLSPRHGSHAAAPTASNLWPDGSIIIPSHRSSRTCCRASFGSCRFSLGVPLAAYSEILRELILR